MLIDWFTVGAQALNFVALVWLMKRFLYKPVLRAIEAREQRIATELASADAKQREAEQERAEFQRKNDELEQRRAGLLEQATGEAKAERQRLLEEARRAADALSASRQETLRSDARSLTRALGRRVQEEVFAIARKALKDLATTSLEERLGEVFTRRLAEMDGQAKARLSEAVRKAPAPVVVRSAFGLPMEQRAVVQNALNEACSADVRIRYETVPDLIGGIEVAAGGLKVGWSIAEYLGGLEKAVAETLGHQAQGGA